MRNGVRPIIASTVRLAALAAGAVSALLAAGCTSTASNETPMVFRDAAEPALAAVPSAPIELPLEVTVHREPWEFASYAGTVLTTDHHRIYTTISAEPILERLPVFLEHAMVRYTTALTPLPRPSRPLETYIFRDRRQWKAKTRQLLPEQAGTFENLGRGGFTTRGISVLYYIDWDGRDKDTFAIASHEGWHQYTQSTFRQPLPIWLEEGIATYMEGYRYQPIDDYPEFRPWQNFERANALGDALRREEMIPLRVLFEETPQSFLADGKDRLLTYYAQVWALTRFLLEGEHGRYRDALGDVLVDALHGKLIGRLMRSPAVIARRGRQEAMNGRSGPWVILAYCTSDMEAFEQEYLAYARSIAR